MQSLSMYLASATLGIGLAGPTVLGPGAILPGAQPPPAVAAALMAGAKDRPLVTGPYSNQDAAADVAKDFIKGKTATRAETFPGIGGWYVRYWTDLAGPKGRPLATGGWSNQDAAANCAKEFITEKIATRAEAFFGLYGWYVRYWPVD